MISPKATLIALSAAAITLAACAVSHAELRFGPWAYWAPYYFPPPAQLISMGLLPESFLPRYETPNPLPPPDGYCPPPPPRRGKRVAASAPRDQTFTEQMSAPLVDVPRRSGGSGYIGPQNSERRPLPSRDTKPRVGSSERPKPVGSDPGARRSILPATRNVNQAQ